MAPPPPPPPPLAEELWEEILLRLPPDNPASLLRASLVCKTWLRIFSSRGFRRRLGELHGAPPMLGFFHKIGSFVPTTAGPAFSLPIPKSHDPSFFLDCRHGRALLAFSRAGNSMRDLLVWEPIMGYQRRVPFPASVEQYYFNAAVVCAADGCDHWDCHGGPFRVVFISSSPGVASAFDYSSEAGGWSEPIPAIHQSHDSSVTMKGSLLVGKSLYFLCKNRGILEYNLDKQGLTVIEPAEAFSMTVIEPAEAFSNYYRSIVLMQAEDGGLGIARIQGLCLYLWSRQRSGDDNAINSDAGWVLRRTIHLDNLLPAAALPKAGGLHVCVIGFVEDANVIFVHTNDGNFTIELRSGRSRKVSSRHLSTVFPFFSFYSPGFQVDAGELG